MSKALSRSTGFFPNAFDDFFRPWNDLFESGSNRMLTVPAVNVIEDPGMFTLELAVPGMKKEDINIDVEGNLLTISAEKEEKKEEKQSRYTREEYNFSGFTRTFTLPGEVKKEKIEAKYEDGVLRVRLPKTEEAKKQLPGKHIAIQ